MPDKPKIQKTPRPNAAIISATIGSVLIIGIGLALMLSGVGLPFGGGLIGLGITVLVSALTGAGLGMGIYWIGQKIKNCFNIGKDDVPPSLASRRMSEREKAVLDRQQRTIEQNDQVLDAISSQLATLDAISQEQMRQIKQLQSQTSSGQVILQGSESQVRDEQERERWEESFGQRALPTTSHPERPVSLSDKNVSPILVSSNPNTFLSSTKHGYSIKERQREVDRAINVLEESGEIRNAALHQLEESDRVIRQYELRA